MSHMSHSLIVWSSASPMTHVDDVQHMTYHLCVWHMRYHRKRSQIPLKMSIQNGTSPRPTQSRNPDFSVSRGTNSNWDFDFMWICAEEFWVSRFGGFRGCSIFSGICHTWHIWLSSVSCEWYESYPSHVTHMTHLFLAYSKKKKSLAY